jgi:hypothetical protein
MGLVLTAICTGVPELAPQRKQTNADHNLDSKNANEEQQIALYRRRGQPCSFIMYSAADYVEMLIIYGECENEVNPYALFSRAFQQRFYINLWVGF